MFQTVACNIFILAHCTLSQHIGGDASFFKEQLKHERVMLATVQSIVHHGGEEKAAGA